MDDLLTALATIRLGDNERGSDFILRYNTLVDQLLRLGEATSNARKVHTLRMALFLDQRYKQFLGAHLGDDYDKLCEGILEIDIVR